MTLTPEMVEIERAAFELFAADFGIDVTRFKHFPDAYKFQQAGDAWKSWLNTADARAQSQRVVGVEELRKLADEWDKTSVLNYGQRSSNAGQLRALIERAGGGV